MVLLFGILAGTAVHTGFMVPLILVCTTGLDLIIRKIVMARHRYPRKATLHIISDTVVQVSFPKVAGFDYNPGQYVYIAVPELSSFEWHPFSLSSAPHQPFVTMHIRAAGNWTSALYNLASEKSELPILMEGPYGNFGVDVTSEKRYKVFLLLCGGIGVTPMQSMFCHLLHEHGTDSRQLKKLKIVWVQRDPQLMEQSQVADVSTRIHRNSTTNGFEQDGDSSKERQRFFDPSECESLASKLLSNAPPSYETDAELDIIYGSAEIRFPDGSTIKFPDGKNEEANKEDDGSTTTTTLGRIVDRVEAMDDVTFSSQQEEDKEFEQEENKEFEQEEDKEFEESEGQELGFERFGDVVDIEIYLTGDTSKRSMLDRGGAAHASNYNGIPGLQQGRPDLASLFTQMRNDAIRFKEKRVAVCVCGPKRISYIARKACIELSDKKVRFDYHEESFG
ncbi:hypothetical protein ACA910_020110 [Epithemia clementina (nom. ined.)]